MAEPIKDNYYFTLLLERNQKFEQFKNKGNAENNPIDIVPGLYKVYLQILSRGKNNAPHPDWVIRKDDKEDFEEDEEPRFYITADSRSNRNMCTLVVELSKDDTISRLKGTPKLITEELLHSTILLHKGLNITPEFKSLVVHGKLVYHIVKMEGETQDDGTVVHKEEVIQRISHSGTLLRYWFNTKESVPTWANHRDKEGMAVS